MSFKKIIIAAFGASLSATAALAGPEQIEFPADFRDTFERYAALEKPDADPPFIRMIYVYPKKLEPVDLGEPLPYGTIVIAEDIKARLGPTGKPELDAHRRLIPSDDIIHVLVQQKGEGWGADYADDKRNGEWEFASFLADGSRDSIGLEPCFGCHKGQADEDYTFSVYPMLKRFTNP